MSRAAGAPHLSAVPSGEPRPHASDRPRTLVVGLLPGPRPRRALAHALDLSSSPPEDVPRLLREGPPDVVIVDASLPPARLKPALDAIGPASAARTFAVVVVSPPGRRSRLEPLLRELADDFVSEGVAERELLVRIRAALRVRGYLRQLAHKNAELQAVTERLQEMARRMAEELRLASNVQRSLLPGPVSHPRLEVAREFLPFREIGGDYFDLMPVGEGRVAIAIGDVMGKGVPAALMAANLKACVRSQVHGDAPVQPRDLAVRVNQLFWDVTRSGLYASLFFGVFDVEGRRFDYVNAGHNPPFVVRPDGRVADLSEGGTVLGLVEGSRYEGGSVRIERDDVLVFYSDGVIDRCNHASDLYGVERLKDASVRSRRDPARIALYSLLGEVQGWSDGTPAEDDATLVVARVR